MLRGKGMQCCPTTPPPFFIQHPKPTMFNDFLLSATLTYMVLATSTFQETLLGSVILSLGQLSVVSGCPSTGCSGRGRRTYYLSRQTVALKTSAKLEEFISNFDPHVPKHLEYNSGPFVAYQCTVALRWKITAPNFLATNNFGFCFWSCFISNYEYDIFFYQIPFLMSFCFCFKERAAA